MSQNGYGADKEQKTLASTAQGAELPAPRLCRKRAGEKACFVEQGREMARPGAGYTKKFHLTKKIFK